MSLTLILIICQCKNIEKTNPRTLKERATNKSEKHVRIDSVQDKEYYRYKKNYRKDVIK